MTTPYEQPAAALVPLPGERRGRWWWRWIRRGLLALIILLAITLAAHPTGRYLARAGWAEARILASRRPIAELIADPATSPEMRDKLQLVLDARDFAADALGLEAEESFTTFAPLRRDTLVLVLSGAARDQLTPVLWWFPIVGHVPYKGYFDFDAARAAAVRLERDDRDAYLRPASAFSTLGFFNDPLLSTTLRQDSLFLANTVIHELTHNTFYAAGEATFNESFATFVGGRGAIAFFLAQGDTTTARRASARWRDDLLLSAFWDSLYLALDSAFTAHEDDRGARLAAREAIYRDARARLVDEIAPRLLTIDPAWATRVPLDNAALLARRTYTMALELFEGVWEREGRDLPRAIARITALAREEPEEPFEAVRRWLASAAPAEPPA